MNKPVPWNVRGVGFDARETARLAAKRAGVSLGEWLNEIIASRAAELGVSADDIEPDDRLEAIAARLSESDEPASEAPRGSKALPSQSTVTAGQRDPLARPAFWPVGGERTTTLPPRLRDHDERVDGGRRMANAPAPASAPTLRRGPQAPLSGTIAARLGTVEDFAFAAASPATEPLAAVTGSNHPARGGDALPHARPSRRSGVPTPPAPVDVDSLDQRLNAVLERLNRSFEEAERFGAAATAGLGTVEQDREPASEVPAAAPVRTELAPPAGKTHAASRPSETSDLATADFSDLHGAFKTLASKLEVLTARSGHDPQDELDLARQVAALARRFDRLQEPAPAPARPEAEIGKIQEDVVQLSARLATLTPAGTLASLEAAVKDLSGRIDLSKLDGVKASVLAPVERLSRDMREAIRAADPSKLIESLQRDMRALSAKVEALDGDRDTLALNVMRGEMREMRQSLDEAAGRLALSDQLLGELRALGARVDGLAERATPAMSRELCEAVGDIRDLLQQFGSGGILGQIDRRITTLADRVDGIADQRVPAALLDELSREIDRAHDSLAARLAQRVEPQQLNQIEERIGTLSAKIDAVGRAGHDLAGLYGLVGELTNRIEEVRHPDADAQALNALQNQIGRLVERFDRSEAGATSLGALERLIGDLFLQIEQSRNVAIDAAENAARTAAQDTLRAALDNPALNGGELTVQTGLDVDHVSQELAELRRIQEASERRVNTTLTALNTTLERLVDRMMADRAAPAPRAASASPQPAVRDGADAEPRSRRKRAGAEQSGFSEPAAAAPFDPEQFLLEPGSLDTPSRAETFAGTTGLSSGAPMVDFDRSRSDNAGSVGSLIAAARRAAQLAQASALEAATKGDDAAADAAVPHPGKAKSFFARRRRPLLLSLAGLVLLLGTLQVVRMSGDRAQDADASAGSAAAPQTPTASEAPSPLARPATSSPGATPAIGDTSLLTPPADAGFAAPGFTDQTDVARSTAAVPAPGTPVASGNGLRDLAAGGSAGAQYELGTRYSDGRGVTRDPKEAALWFERAAQQGLAPAQYRLGSAYEKGVGRVTDANLAMGWYEKAATGGNVRAMHNLAVMLAEGAGAKPDYGKAVTWFTKAASYGVRDSQFNLAVLFARGLGVPQNLGQSYAWFALAAQQGDPDAAKKRDTVAAKLDAKGLADAKATASSFKPLTPDPAGNDVAPPAGGWDSALPKTAGAKAGGRVSSL